MRLLGMLVRPWLLAMRVLGLVPRSVAVDRPIFAKRPCVDYPLISRFAIAMQDTHFCIIAMIGAVNASKIWSKFF